MKRISSAFLRGYSRAFDLSGTKKWPDLSDSTAKDYEALRGDWENVGRVIRKGTKDFGRT